MPTKTLIKEFGGRTFTLSLFDAALGGGAIKIIHLDGDEENIAVPRINKEGLPSPDGREPTFDDLSSIAKLYAENIDTLMVLVCTRKTLELARQMESDLIEGVDALKWLRLVEKARGKGVLDALSSDAPPGPVDHPVFGTLH